MKIIFEKEIILHPENSKTNIFLPFKVENGFDRMEIHFSYTPKELDDKALSLKYINAGMEKYAPEKYRSGYQNSEDFLPVLNLVTLSLDSPEGYLGCAHRHEPEQIHIISEKSSSPGFVPQKPVSGDWRAVVNVHAVVTETCTCRLKIFNTDGSEVLL
jgi:hypothetical protein